MNREHITWDEMQKGAEFILESFESSGDSFDRVVGLARGGLPLAVHISHALDIDMISEKLQLRDSLIPDSKYIISAELRESATRGDKILIIDDISDTGDTLKLITQELLKLTTPDKIRIATLVYKTTSMFEPDVWVYGIKPGSWIVFPWEINIKTVFGRTTALVANTGCVQKEE